MRHLLMILFLIIQYLHSSLFAQTPYPIYLSPQHLQPLGQILIIGQAPLSPTLTHRRSHAPLFGSNLIDGRALLRCLELEHHSLQLLAFFLSPITSNMGQVNGSYLQSVA